MDTYFGQQRNHLFRYLNKLLNRMTIRSSHDTTLGVRGYFFHLRRVSLSQSQEKITSATQGSIMTSFSSSNYKITYQK